MPNKGPWFGIVQILSTEKWSAAGLHLKQLLPEKHAMKKMTRTTTRMRTARNIRILTLFHHIFLLSCLPVVWNWFACKFTCRQTVARENDPHLWKINVDKIFLRALQMLSPECWLQYSRHNPKYSCRNFRASLETQALLLYIQHLGRYRARLLLRWRHGTNVPLQHMSAALPKLYEGRFDSMLEGDYPIPESLWFVDEELNLLPPLQHLFYIVYHDIFDLVHLRMLWTLSVQLWKHFTCGVPLHKLCHKTMDRTCAFRLWFVDLQECSLLGKSDAVM